MRRIASGFTALLWAGVLGLTACRSDAASDREMPNSSERAVVSVHMKDHFYRIDEIRQAVGTGRLDAVREPAEWMAGHPQPAVMPEAWRPWVDVMRAEATRAADAGDLVTAARATAAMAGTCGECHRALEASVGFAVETAPAQGEGAVPHMQRHAWASARMWEGLVSPSEIVWRGGAEILAEAPIPTENLAGADEAAAEMAAMARHVHELGTRALEPTDAKGRVELYGELLATCAGCHRAGGTGGSPVLPR